MTKATKAAGLPTGVKSLSGGGLFYFFFIFGTSPKAVSGEGGLQAMQVSLKRKLIFAMCVLLIVSLAAVCTASYWSSSMQLGASLDKEAQQASSRLSIEIDSFFQQKVAIVETVGKMLSDDMNFDHDLKVIQDAQTKNPEFETWFFSHDLSGTKVINFKGEVTNVADRVHYQEAGKGEGKLVVSEPVVSKRTGNNIVTIIVPLMKDNKQYGYMGSTIPINTIQETVSKEVFGTTGYAFLVSKAGTYIWHPNKEAVLKDSIVKSEIPELKTAYDEVQKGQTGLIHYQQDGVDRLASYSSTQLNWGVFVTAPIDELHAPVQVLLIKLVSISAIVLVLVVAIVYWLANQLLKPIQRLNQAVNVVAQGDLTQNVTVKGNDEIAVLSKDFNQTVSHLKQLIEGVSHSSEEVIRLSQDVAAGIEHATQNVNRINDSIHQIADGAKAQAVSSQEVSISMSDMAAGIVKIAETSSQVSEAAREAAERAEQGNASVEKAVVQMQNIEEGTSKAATAIEQLNARSKEIEGILDTINQLTAQINLLALNASIEAARAGEHGRGFAVVAGEVKKLANQSEESTAQIAQLITEIQHDTSRAVEVINSSNRDVQEGMELIEEVRQTFGSILESSRNVAGHILEVSAASEEMSAGSEEVSASIEEMHGIAKHASNDAQNVVEAASDQLMAIQEIGQSVERLNSVVEELKQGVGRFKL